MSPDGPSAVDQVLADAGPALLLILAVAVLALTVAVVVGWWRGRRRRRVVPSGAERRLDQLAAQRSGGAR